MVTRDMACGLEKYGYDEIIAIEIRKEKVARESIYYTTEIFNGST